MSRSISCLLTWGCNNILHGVRRLLYFLHPELLNVSRTLWFRLPPALMPAGRPEGRLDDRWGAACVTDGCCCCCAGVRAHGGGPGAAVQSGEYARPGLGAEEEPLQGRTGAKMADSWEGAGSICFPIRMFSYTSDKLSIFHTRLTSEARPLKS